MLRKLATALGMSVLLAACQTTTPPNERLNVDEIERPTLTQNQAAQGGQNNAQQQQRAQSVITVHLAQQQPDEQLIPVQIGEGQLYALPQPILIQTDMQQVTPVTAENGDTFLLFEMNNEGSQKLATVTERAQGHFLLLSVQGQLVSMAQIGQPISDGNLLMGTQGQQHTEAILEMMRGAAQ